MPILDSQTDQGLNTPEIEHSQERRPSFKYENFKHVNSSDHINPVTIEGNPRRWASAVVPFVLGIVLTLTFIVIGSVFSSIMESDMHDANYDGHDFVSNSLQEEMGPNLQGDEF